MASRIDPATAHYLSLMRAIPALGRAEELALARAYLQRGDTQAGRRVIGANLRHVVALALRYRTLGVPLTDLVAQGTLGLIQALERFDPERGLRLATYGNHWIRAEMLSAALKARSLVGGGVGVFGAKYALRMRREHARLQARLGASSEVITILAQRYRKSPQRIADILYELDQHDASLEAAAGPTRSALGELLPGAGDPADEAADRRRAQHELVRAVAQARHGLDPRERYIVEHRLMAEDDARKSLEQIGRHFGVSRERARQLEAALKRKLRVRLTPVAERLALQPAA